MLRSHEQLCQRATTKVGWRIDEYDWSRLIHDDIMAWKCCPHYLWGSPWDKGGFPSQRISNAELSCVLCFQPEQFFEKNKQTNKKTPKTQKTGWGWFELPWNSCEVTVIHWDKITNINFIRICNKHLDFWSYCSWRSTFFDSFNLKRFIALQFSSIQFKQFYSLKSIHSNK